MRTLRQIRTVLDCHEMDIEKNLFEKSVQYAVAYEKQFHKVKNSHVIKAEYCDSKQRNVLE